MLTINEVFHSIQGESSYAGRPCVFIRLTACDLRCTWCDSAYAFYEGGKRTLDEVVDEAMAFGCPLVEVTGGEPLLQKDVYPLIERLCEAGMQVLIETGGHRSIADVPDHATVDHGREVSRAAGKPPSTTPATSPGCEPTTR